MTTTPERHLQLRREAHWLSARLIDAMLTEPDDARWRRLKRIERRAERRYWRRHEAAYGRGNRTPPWLIKNANAGY